MSKENDDYKRGYEFALQYAVSSILTDMIRWRDSDDENYNDFMRGYNAGIRDTVTGIRSGFTTCHMEYNAEYSNDELYPTIAYECSVCGNITLEGKPNFCPNCGKKVLP